MKGKQEMNWIVSEAKFVDNGDNAERMSEMLFSNAEVVHTRAEAEEKVMEWAKEIITAEYMDSGLSKKEIAEKVDKEIVGNVDHPSEFLWTYDSDFLAASWRIRELGKKEIFG